jgi:DNA-binding IclR family transcriptional regulator
MEKNIIPNLQNACRLMDYLARAEGGVSLPHVSMELSIPRTTTYRILKTLEAENFVREEGRLFHLGPKLIHLGQVALGELDIRKVAIPHLRGITEEVDETCHFAVPCENHSLILEVSLSSHPLRAVSRPGTMVDLHCSATGKIFIAYLHEAKLKHLCESGRFEARTRHTLTTYAALKREAESVRERGYSMDDEEYHEGVRCLAVPVFDRSGKLVASIGLTAAKQRVPKAKIEAIVDVLRRRAMAVSEEIG